jgi:autotransporter-associated beta strand protein
MSRAAFFSAATAAAMIFGATQSVRAEDPPDLFLEHLSDYMWTGPNGGTWQSAANWLADTDPAPVDPSLTLGYPDDPGRMDMDDVDIVPLIGANFSSALVSDLTVNIGAADVTVASVKLGGTGAAVTTAIDSTGGLLVFENQEANDFTTNPGDPGDPNAEPPIPPTLAEPIWSFNQGNSLIWSTGTAGAGKENRIDADVKLNDLVDVEGDRDLHIYGEIFEGDRMTAGGDPFRPSSITSLLSGGARVIIHSNIHLTEFDEVPEEEEGGMGTQDRTFNLNVGRGLVLPEDPQMPPNDPPTRQGIIEFLGHFEGEGPEMDDRGGWVQIGNGQSSLVPLGTVILRGDSVGADPENPVFDGRIVLNRSNLVLGHDNALGGGDLTSGNPTPAIGFNFISDHDDRNIGTAIQVAQWHTVRGASGIAGLEDIGDHSIEFSGPVGQTNTRGWINLLPAGTELVLSGPQYPLEGDENDDPDRIYTVDGTGLTRITGGIHNRPPDALFAGNGHFRKRGTGTVIIDYDESDTEDTATDHTGFLWMEGGNLHYNSVSDLPDGAYPDGGILSRGGAVGFDEGLFTGPGVVSANGSTFLAQLNNSSMPNHGSSGTGFFTAPYFRVFFVTNPILATYGSGGLMLAADEYGMNLDFNTSPLSNAANMTLAAHEGGSTYTGTITPSTSVPTNPNTYQLGGGAGTLTLPNDNQLTGSRHLLVTNGGEVRLEGTHNYTGVTKIQGKFWTSIQSDAAADRFGGGDESDDYRSTTLTVTQLVDGASSLGNSTLSNPANLVVQGGTLRYDGTSAVSSSRLFTVGTAGATIDASGDGPLTFSSTAALGVDVAEDRAGVISNDTPGTGAPRTLIFGRSSASTAFTFNTEDLVPGIRIASVPSGGSINFQEGLVITDIPATDVISVGGVAEWSGWSGTVASATPITFGPAPARFLTLSGENSGDNTLAPLVGDAPDIGNATMDEADDGYGTVGIRKTGTGKWILTNNSNSYTGQTLVQAGTLLVNANQTAATGLTTVSAGATLGGTGMLGGGLTSTGNVAPGTSVGTLSVNGNVMMGQGASFKVELLGATADLLAVTGDLLLDTPATETTPEMTLMNALDVSTLGAISGSSWVIASYSGTLFGQFETVTPGYSVTYGSGTNSVITLMLAAAGVAGDYNGNGIVDAADYTTWRDRLGQNMALPNTDPGDVDGMVTVAEYNYWVSRFGATSGAAAGSLAAGTVPEPAAALLTCLALIAASFVRRRC